MYTVIQVNNPMKCKVFNTLEEANEYVKRQRRAKGFYEVREEKLSKSKSWKDSIDFSSAVEVTRANVKEFYHKSGFIRVVDSNGRVLHVGKTSNMGKVFSNYVNCANYNQSYNFDLESGDQHLYFLEGDIR